MNAYLELLARVRRDGRRRPTRARLLSTGEHVDALTVFGAQARYDLAAGFPLLTTKRVPFRAVAHELFWFLQGSTNIGYLKDNGVTIWDEWIKPDFQVGGPSDERPLTWIPVRDRPHTPAPQGGIPSTGGLDFSKGTVGDKLRGTWRKMMGRCYDPDHHRYHLYGARGASVDVRWHDPATFIADVQKLPNWEHKLRSWNEYEIDKDYYGARCYAPETSVWLHTAENNYYTSAAAPFEVKKPGGPTRTFLTLSHGETELDISRSTLHRLLACEQRPETLKGDNAKARDWEFSKIEPRVGHVLRMAFSRGELGPVYGKQWRNFGGVDQVANLVRDIALVRADPAASAGRRLIVSAWNPVDVPDMALPPCHTLFQMDVDGDRLHCQMYQRSADLFLGVPFNIASYALLTHLVARAAGLVPGEFIHSIGNAHIYVNHLDAVDSQLARTPGPLPVLRFRDGAPTDLFALTADDCEVLGYAPQGGLRGEVAV
jgi:thymidylate synthase